MLTRPVKQTSVSCLFFAKRRKEAANSLLQLLTALGIPMKSEQGVPPKKKFFIGVLLTLIAVFVFNIFIPDAKDDRFRLMFSGFDKNDIQRIVINIGDSTFDFVNPKLELLSVNKSTLKFVVPNETGMLNLTVTTKSGAEYLLSNIEYKSGKSNYITKQENRIIYVKAHWQ